jgi:hypothetical protein
MAVNFSNRLKATLIINALPISKHRGLALTKRGAGLAVKSRSVFTNTIEIN